MRLRDLRKLVEQVVASSGGLTVGAWENVADAESGSIVTRDVPFQVRVRAQADADGGFTRLLVGGVIQAIEKGPAVQAIWLSEIFAPDDEVTFELNNASFGLGGGLDVRTLG